MSMQFGSEYNVDKTFILKAYKYVVGTGYASANVSSIVGDSEVEIVFPAPQSGFVLNESGNWEEMEGLQSTGGLVSQKALNSAKSMLGSAAHKLTPGRFINDYASLAYSGSNFRTWSFNWEFTYPEKSEAETLFKIINKIRQLSLPEYSSGLPQYPYMWKLFPIKENVLGVYLKDCVITSVNVDYTPDGVMQLHVPPIRDAKDAKETYPTKVALTLDFKELYRADRRDILS